MSTKSSKGSRIIPLIMGIMIALSTYAQETIRLGDQIWMKKNLDTQKFRNGDQIRLCRNRDEWKQAMKNREPACCYYNFEAEMGLKYGMIYNVFVLLDDRELAPQNYKLPDGDDWMTLVNTIQGSSDKLNVGNRIKSTGGWTEMLERTEASSGFEALPGGYCSKGGYCMNEGKGADFWVDGWRSAGRQRLFRLYSDYAHYQMVTENAPGGYYIRCLMDQESPKYKEITLGFFETKDFYVTSHNLDATRYQNGDEIPQATDSASWERYAEQRVGAWCYLNFNEENGKKYGKMYNVYAINDARGILPTGWTIPTKKEYNSLTYDPDFIDHLMEQQGGAYEMDEKFTTEKTSFWRRKDKKKKKAVYFIVYPDSSYSIAFTTAKNIGCYVRAIKKIEREDEDK
ncbi:MAG: hypothetical protein EP338_04190 [Bacteroidetes bacterium]|nr:MAG: hypothetical protein EP338_04190 [Bacteroidota bacterium]